MDEKKTNPTDVDPALEDDAGNTGGPVYDLDSDSPDPVDSGDDGDAGEESAGDQAGAGHRVSRQEILDRFQEKNDAIARLTREKLALEKEKGELASQAKEFKDKWLRSAAEFENFRKRSAKEWELLKQQSKSEVVLEVLNSLDDFERAFAVVEGTEENEFVQGIRLIYNNFLSGLSKLGVTELDAHQKSFDPNVHMAVGQIESETVESGHVAEIVQKGYTLNGVLIRPARVIVAK